MTDLRDYKNKNFSITVNSRMKGIELRFENTMTEEQIEQIKEAGFRWSKRQQMWYAYQNEKTIAYAKSLESQYEANLKNDENKQEKTVDISTDKKVEEKQNESNSFSGELFSESELEELATINEKLNPQLKKHQVIYYYEDSGIDEGLDFMTLSEAQKEGKTSLKEWNLDKSENGFAIFNRETKQIEAIHGYFPVEKVFRNEILAINGYKIDESKQEVSLSEIQKSTKEKLAEQGASKELFDSHVVFATPDKIKKEYADSYEW